MKCSLKSVKNFKKALNSSELCGEEKKSITWFMSMAHDQFFEVLVLKVCLMVQKIW